MIDMAKLGLPRKKNYSDATLLGWKKPKLVDYIRELERNYDAMIAVNSQQAQNFKDMLDYMRGHGGRNMSDKFILTILFALACPLLLPVVIEDEAEEEA